MGNWLAVQYVMLKVCSKWAEPDISEAHGVVVGG